MRCQWMICWSMKIILLRTEHDWHWCCCWHVQHWDKILWYCHFIVYKIDWLHLLSRFYRLDAYSCSLLCGYSNTINYSPDELSRRTSLHIYWESHKKNKSTSLRKKIIQCSSLYKKKASKTNAKEGKQSKLRIKIIGRSLQSKCSFTFALKIFRISVNIKVFAAIIVIFCLLLTWPRAAVCDCEA